MKVSDVSIAPAEEVFTMGSHQALLKPDDISPLSAYYTLKGLFGPPNCDSFDESKIQWAYFFRVPDAYLNVYDYKLETWSIAVYEDDNSKLAREIFGSEIHKDWGAQFAEFHDKANKEKAEKIGRDFLSLLRKHVPQSAAKIRSAESDASEFVLQNPFTLYYRSAVKLLEEVPDAVIDASHYYRSAFFLFIAAFEGLLNLIYELYLKADLRDERIYDRLSREQIDIKVRLAPLYCDCFSDKPLDYNSDVFKRFHSIVNLRNDFIHANFTKPMKRSVVLEDGYTFIVEHSSRDKNGLPKSIDVLTEVDLNLIKESISQMIDLIAEGMKPRFRREFRRIIKEDHIHVTFEDGEMIVVESEW
jgi:hypothetical protein